MQLKITYSVIIWSARLYGILRIFSAWFPADILKNRSRLTKNLVGKVGLNALKMHLGQYCQWPLSGVNYLVRPVTLIVAEQATYFDPPSGAFLWAINNNA